MAQKNKITGYVKTQTVIFLIIAAFVMGFVAGTVLTVYKSGSGISFGQNSRQQASGAPNPTAEQTRIIADLERQTSANPDDTQAWISLGHLYFDTHQIEKAIRAYETSLKHDADNANVWTDLGVMYRRSKRAKEAIRAFDKAMEIDPKHEISRFNKGIVLMHDLNDLEGAIRAWKALLEINPVATAPNGQSVDEMVQQLEKSAGS